MGSLQFSFILESAAHASPLESFSVLAPPGPPKVVDWFSFLPLFLTVGFQKLNLILYQNSLDFCLQI